MAPKALLLTGKKGGGRLKSAPMGVTPGTFDGECNLLFVFVNTQDLNFDLLSDVQNLTGMVNTVPGQLTDMNQPICTSKINKGPEFGKIADNALAYFAGEKLIQE